METVRIGLWGGPGSGKTTYLAALRIAALLDETSDWKLQGQDDLFPGSTKFLAEQTNFLRRGKFPAPTHDSADFGYRVSGMVIPSLVDQFAGVLGVRKQLRNEIMGKLKMARPMNFTLHVRDYPGGDFLSTDYEDELWQYLSDCHGLIYLFDPELEETEYPNYEYIQQSADYVMQLMTKRNQIENNRLPHYLAVCITKFDEPGIFSKLQASKLIRLDLPGMEGIPYVRDAKEVFNMLADRLTIRTIERYFQPNRIRYFMTSSIGFYTDESGTIDAVDCCNVLDTPDGKLIRGEVTPINVFTPLIWIENQVSNGQNQK